MFVSMKEKMQNDNPVLGTEVVPTHENVKKWLTLDLNCAILSLQAIQQDPDLLDNLAAFMLGRLENQINAKRNQNPN